MLAGLAVLVAGCGNSKAPTRAGEDSVASTSKTAVGASTGGIDASAAPSCGHEVQTHGKGYDEVARTCLWDAYQAGKPGELMLTRHTIEGDPVTFTLRVRSASLIEVIEDNRDHFGAQGVRSTSCSALERTASTNERRGFVVRGCRGSVETIEVP